MDQCRTPGTPPPRELGSGTRNPLAPRQITVHAVRQSKFPARKTVRTQDAQKQREQPQAEWHGSTQPSTPSPDQLLILSDDIFGPTNRRDRQEEKGGLGIVMGWVHGGGDSAFKMFRGAGRSRVIACTCPLYSVPVWNTGGVRLTWMMAAPVAERRK